MSSIRKTQTPISAQPTLVAHQTSVPAGTTTLLTTDLTWNHLALEQKTEQQIQQIIMYLQHVHGVDAWNQNHQPKSGYRVLFHGPSGTGKTLAAALIGKALKTDVHQVSLAQLVSRHRGETEKNLAAIFAHAEQQSSILLFDEADALFGRRTVIRDAHDGYANQELTYLLQKMEAHPGLVIVETNSKTNLDPAFIRRLEAIIDFPQPSAELRRQLWQQAFDSNVHFHPPVDWGEIAQAHMLTGGQITEAARSIGLKAAQRPDKSISPDDIIHAIRIEYQKSGRH